MCDIWRPEDIPQIFITGCSRPVSNSPPPDLQAHNIATQLPSLSRNSQLPSPVTPSTQLSPASYPFPATAENNLLQPQQLVPLKGFVHEVLCRSRTSVSVMQTALCYLAAMRFKVPELVEKEKNGTGVQGEIDLSYRVVKGDMEAKEWCELELDSIMDNYINTDAAVDFEAVPAAETMSTSAMELAERYEVAWLESVPYISLTGLEPNIAQDLAWTGMPLKIPTGPLPPVFPLP
ncbi:hypothetical protein FIBSPDRAFT_15251 [Athelia psychrophila]|uniref:Uncharacterized protein n=1 Tax=Athelia psychrophila TaxID=1759441 RepID=A0A166XFJ7_9AGAM|nr:hypothetical protein FIBSPDRAFT_15251 [Fibularhizoctonia sp. CBS 109695]